MTARSIAPIQEIALALLLWLGLAACASPRAGGPAAGAVPDSERFRVLIMTDMTHDDGNSLIRYLYYAPHFDTEAIIVTPQLPDYDYDADEPWEKVQSILAAYREEREQLLEHDPGFPTYQALVGVTKRGRGALPIIWLTEDGKFAGQIGDRQVGSTWGTIRYPDWIGEGTTPHGEPKDSEGSEFLQQVFDRDDDRPIFVQLWGGPITLVQALYRYEQRKGPEKMRRLLNKLHVYSIHLQDITVDYMIDLDQVRATRCSHLGETRSTYDGERVAPRWFVFDKGHFWKYLEAMEPAQVNGHGPMSTLYDGGGEGDTPAFLYLVSALRGLNDPLDPTQGSWGNMFHPAGEGFPEGYYHTCPGSDRELMRWAPDATNSFLARLQWSVKEPGEVNREPVAVLNGDAGRDVIHRRARPGEHVDLDASGSHDPDGDAVRFNWSVYAAASSYHGELRIAEPGNARQSITVPQDLGDGSIHLLLEVRDDGSPELVAYRRVIISGAP
jgi:hypothetical protein